MAVPFGWDGTDNSTQEFNPFISGYVDPPTPPIYNYDSGYRRPPGWMTRQRPRRGGDGDDGDDLNNKIGYETDWEYPKWLIRMAQWRNF